jgi:LmbE family N-acetylglucosaminyl deacetylase
MKKLIPFIYMLLIMSSCNEPSTTKQAAKSTLDKGKILMAIFAHSDDESTILPILSKYSREGVNIYLVTVTDGSKGVYPHANIPAGDSLAKVRAGEALCVTETLDINPPILLNYPDGELTLWDNIYSLDDKIDSLFRQYQPDVVITFGPDGGYGGHPDHRIVSNIVTEVFQAKEFVPRQLLYVGWPTNEPASKQRFETDLVNFFAENMHKTQKKFLTYQIPYDDKDLQVMKEAIRCYWSQFTMEQQDEVFLLLAQPERKIYFRPFLGSSKVQSDIFKMNNSK